MTTQQTTAKVGDVYVRVWGYDETHTTYYELVEISPSGKTGKARRIRSVRVPGDQGAPSYQRVTADRSDDRFDLGPFAGRCARCGNQHQDRPGWDGHAWTDLFTWQARFNRVTDDGDHAYPWDGQADSETVLGWGR